VTVILQSQLRLNQILVSNAILKKVKNYN